MTKFLLTILAVVVLNGVARAEPGIAAEAATTVRTGAEWCKGFVLGSLVLRDMTDKQVEEILGPPVIGFGGGFTTWYPGLGLTVVFVRGQDSDGNPTWVVRSVRSQLFAPR